MILSHEFIFFVYLVFHIYFDILKKVLSKAGVRKKNKKEGGVYRREGSTFYTLWVICVGWYFHFKHVSWGINIYHLEFGDERVRVLGFHIWNHLLETSRARSFFQTFKKSLKDWFGPKCKCRVSSYWHVQKFQTKFWTFQNFGR